MSWRPSHPVTGVTVSGDKRQKPLSDWRVIRWIQKGYALGSKWDTLSVIEVVNEDEPYYVGFTDDFGETWICTTPITTPRFAGLVGHEDCTFFAVLSLEDHLSLELKEVDRRPRNDPGPGVTVI